MKRRHFERAFTLIELLVALAVLTLMSALLFQVVSMSSNMVSASTSKLHGLAGARFVLDRIGLDLASLVNRREVGQFFAKTAGNDTLVFQSEVDSYGEERKITGVGYRIRTNSPNSFQLERGTQSGKWTDTFPKPAPELSSLDFDILSEAVLRLEFAFVTKTGQLICDQTLTDFSDVSAIVVAVAALDPSARKALEPGQIEALSQTFRDPSPGAQDLISGWEAELIASGLPPRVIQNVRFFQRYYDVR